MDVTDIFWEMVHQLSGCTDAEEFRMTPEFEKMAERVAAAERAGVPLTLERSSLTEVSHLSWDGDGLLSFRNVDELFRGVLGLLYKTEDRQRTQELQRCISVMESWSILQELCGSMQGQRLVD